MTHSRIPTATHVQTRRCKDASPDWTRRSADVTDETIDAALGRARGTIESIMYGTLPSSLSCLRGAARRWSAGYHHRLVKVLARLTVPHRRVQYGKRAILLLGRAWQDCEPMRCDPHTGGKSRCGVSP